MNVIEPKVVIEAAVNGVEILQRIERAGRTCYKSEGRCTPTSAAPFISSILKRGHESVIEHEQMTVRFICDRGVSHELVRHRLAAFSQESTRYCDYSDEGKFDRGVSFIRPYFFPQGSTQFGVWREAMLDAARRYFSLTSNGATPQEARSVLPNSTKTEIVVSANLREWRHIFRLRTATAAHPQMRQVMVPLLARLRELVPIIFDDLPELGHPSPALVELATDTI